LNSTIRSTSPQGTYFVLELKNNTLTNQPVVFSIENNISGVGNPDNSDATQNVDLNFTILDFESRSEISTVDIGAGKTYKFLVKAISSADTPIDRWNTSQLNLISSTQAAVKASLLLQLSIPNNSEE